MTATAVLDAPPAVRAGVPPLPASALEPGRRHPGRIERTVPTGDTTLVLFRLDDGRLFRLAFPRGGIESLVDDLGIVPGTPSGAALYAERVQVDVEGIPAERIDIGCA